MIISINGKIIFVLSINLIIQGKSATVITLDILMDSYTIKPFSEMHYYTLLILFQCGCMVWGQSRGVDRGRKNEFCSFLPACTYQVLVLTILH